jgi:hypothetical protein
MAARSIRNVNRQAVFAAKQLHSFDVIGVFVADEDRFDLCHVQFKAVEALLDLAAAEAGIDQYGFLFISNVITVAVASTVQRCHL